MGICMYKQSSLSNPLFPPKNIKDILSKLKESSSMSSKPQFCLGMFLSCQSTFSVFVWTLVHISEYGCHPCAYKTSANTPKLTHLFNELSKDWSKKYLLLQISSWMSVVSTYIFCIGLGSSTHIWPQGPKISPNIPKLTHLSFDHA